MRRDVLVAFLSFSSLCFSLSPRRKGRRKGGKEKAPREKRGGGVDHAASTFESYPMPLRRPPACAEEEKKKGGRKGKGEERECLRLADLGAKKKKGGKAEEKKKRASVDLLPLGKGGVLLPSFSQRRGEGKRELYQGEGGNGRDTPR